MTIDRHDLNRSVFWLVAICKCCAHSFVTTDGVPPTCGQRVVQVILQVLEELFYLFDFQETPQELFPGPMDPALRLKP